VKRRKRSKRALQQRAANAVIVRLAPAEKARWKRLAKRVSLSTWIKQQVRTIVSPKMKTPGLRRPTSGQLAQLQSKIYKLHPIAGSLGSDQHAACLRKRSSAFAKAMRARGWLHEEGYAPGSWAAP